jgi:hypothetical protein
MKKIIGILEWSEESINAINTLKRLYKEGFMSNQIYNRMENSSEDKYITIIPNLTTEPRQGRINWIEQIPDGFFLMGITLIGNSYKDPYSGCSGVYCACLDTEEGFKILFNTSEWSMGDIAERGKRILNQIKKE